ncbi:MAG: type IV pilus assembly protein PilM [Candidatus Magnetoglobus multicellularis str. Araruama]|uniref:Type IV pilus assembly protein PilM n=1 Tax=Candidatus Magnetoglobus multicellularis str. Araruama TaxID=890399 RepID=A0A1V1PFA7_9BACT|nr:MAG: type IV pilus assembly protein PilM [Candidatus Magnetoglobus multicellularis str. Araruama]
MFFRKKHNQLIGLDLGSHTIKFCELIEKKRIWVLKKFGLKTIPREIIQEGMVRDQEVLAKEIEFLLKRHNVTEKNVAISVSGFSVIVKRISMTQMTDAELRSRINYEAEQYIPFDINDVNLDFQILGETEGKANNMDVVLVAAKKDMILDYVTTLNSIDLNVAVIDVDCFTLQNIYTHNYKSDEIVALIDVGACKTNINIIQNMKSLHLKDFSIGGDSMTQDITNRIECSYEEAEEIKLAGESEMMTQEEFMEIKASTIGYWASEFRRALDSFISANPDKQISKVFMSGGSANVTGLRQLLTEELKIPVESLNPFQMFDTSSPDLDSEFITKIAPQACVCMGLGIRRAGDK